MKTDGNGVPIVDLVHPDKMYGDTPLERELNAYLTQWYVLTGGVPADECLRESRHIIKYYTGYSDPKSVRTYLVRQFGDSESPHHDTAAAQVISIISSFQN